MSLSVVVCVRGWGRGELTPVDRAKTMCCLCRVLTLLRSRGSVRVRHANKPAQKLGLCPSSYCRRGSASRAWRTSCRRLRKGARACKAVSTVRACIDTLLTCLRRCCACQQTSPRGPAASYVALAVTCLASLSCVCACAGAALQAELEGKSSTPCSSCSTLQAQLEVGLSKTLLVTCSLCPPPPHCCPA